MNNNESLLQLLQANGLGLRTFDKVIAKLDRIDISLNEVLAGSVSDIAHTLEVNEGIVESIIGNKDIAGELAEELERNSIEIVLKNNPLYPQKLIRRLGPDKAPPVLFVQGDPGILSTMSAGFCGSRKSSREGLSIAAESARLVAESGVNVVSGYAVGVDMAAHTAALAAGGTTTFVLAEGILQFRAKQGIREYLSEGNYVIVSEFLPKLSWIARNAMIRNSTICGLSDVLILVESASNGGTYQAGKTALNLQCPLFVVDYGLPVDSAAGNRILLEHGAYALKGDSDGLPDIDGVFKVIDDLKTDTVRNGSQITLFSD